jgi:hypothetical protein
MTITLTGVSALAAILFLAVVYLLKNPEKADKWNNIAGRLIFWSKETREKRLISSSLDYRITSAAKQINRESDGILPFGLRIKWRKPEEASSYVDNDEVVVVLHKDDNADKNIVEACIAYIPNALLPKSRNSVDSTLLYSMDNYLTSKILSQGNYTSAYNYFCRSILDELRTSNTSFNSYFEALGHLDSVGLFTRVLLEEFKVLGDLLYGTLEQSAYKDETAQFLRFLDTLATRKRGDDTTPLFFPGRKIRIGIVLFAKQETLTAIGTEAYIRRIHNDFKMGAQRIFLFSYAHKVDSLQYDSDGFIVGVRKRNDFGSLDIMESKCQDLECLKLLKKELYYPKDSAGKARTAKYYLYECIR